jgi:hypothetical protein
MADIPGSISSQPAAATLTGAEVLPLDQAVGSPVAATALVVGQGYRIVSLGNTNWAAAGAGATPAVGTVFACTAVGTGTGTAQQLVTRRATTQQVAALAPGTDLAYDPTTRLLTSSTGGADVTLPLAGTVVSGGPVAGLQTAADAARVAQLGEDDSPQFAGLAINGTATAAQFDGDLTGAVSCHVKNVSDAPLAALTPLVVVGSQGDTDILEVVPARADSSSTMPAAGLALAAMGTNGMGHMITSGVVTNVNTAGLQSGQSRFVAPTGGLTATKPATQIQQVAIVGRVHSSTGTLIVSVGPVTGSAAFAATTDFATAQQGTDARIPLAHKSTHATGGADALTAGDVGADPAGTAANALSSHLVAASHFSQAQVRALLSASSPLAYDANTGVFSLGAIASSKSFDIQIFTVSGTWTKPANAVLVYLWMAGGGPGGGSGRVGAAGTDRGGGGGGSGAAGIFLIANASRFADSEAVVIGAAGLGGAAVTTPDTNGNPGTNGGTTTFAGINAVGGLFGGGGTTTVGAAGAARANSCFHHLVDTALASSIAGGIAGTSTANATGVRPGPGGAGASLSSANARTSAGGTSAGLTGATIGTVFPNSGGNSGDGVNGTDGQFIQYFGTGGGGGNSNPLGNGGRGGDGIAFGSGGGGGGSAPNGFFSGRGGHGGPAILVAMTLLS